MITRRTLIKGIGLFLAGPAIVRAASLMPVKAWAEPMMYYHHDIDRWLPFAPKEPRPAMYLKSVDAWLVMGEKMVIW